MRDCWRIHKRRIKQTYYEPYENDDDRLKHRPGTIGERDFRILLQYWNDPTVQKISTKNIEIRGEYKNEHIVGPVSFARKRLELKREGGSPSKTKMFEETQKRTERRKYKRINNDDTVDKIKKIKEIEAWQEAGLGLDDDEDPFDQVLKKKERPGRLRLHGRGVSRRSLKGKNIDEPTPWDPEFIEAIKASLGDEMQKEFDAHKERMEAEKEKRTQMQMELDAQKKTLLAALRSYLPPQCDCNFYYSVRYTWLKLSMVSN